MWKKPQREGNVGKKTSSVLGIIQSFFLFFFFSRFESKKWLKIVRKHHTAIVPSVYWEDACFLSPLLPAASLWDEAEGNPMETDLTQRSGRLHRILCWKWIVLFADAIHFTNPPICCCFPCTFFTHSLCLCHLRTWSDSLLILKVLHYYISITPFRNGPQELKRKMKFSREKNEMKETLILHWLPFQKRNCATSCTGLMGIWYKAAAAAMLVQSFQKDILAHKRSKTPWMPFLKILSNESCESGKVRFMSTPAVSCTMFVRDVKAYYRESSGSHAHTKNNRQCWRADVQQSFACLAITLSALQNFLLLLSLSNFWKQLNMEHFPPYCEFLKWELNEIMLRDVV